MEEVSYLADKIGILEQGKLILQGSSRELIENNGKYFSLIINKKMDYDEAKKISSYISNNYYKEEEYNININTYSDFTTEKTESNPNEINPKAIKLEVFKERVIIKISNQLFKKEKSSELFEYLKNNHGIDNYLIINDKLEDIFINIISNNKNNKNILAANKTNYMVILSSNENLKRFKGLSKFKHDLKV